MSRKAAFVLGLFLITAGPEAFADGGNMVGVEIRPLQVFLGTISILSLSAGDVFPFTVAPWYGRNLTENLSVGTRLGYGLLKFGTWTMHSFSADVFARAGYGSIFLEGSLGHVNLLLRDFNGERNRESWTHNLRWEARLGQRNRLGLDGRFFSELSLGLSAPFYLGRDTRLPDTGLIQELTEMFFFVGGIHFYYSLVYAF